MLDKIINTSYGLLVLTEYKFHPTRKWRFDYCIPDESIKIAFEVEGGVWMKKARHTSPTGFIKDMEKYNTATAMGWKVIRILPGDYAKALEYLDLILKDNPK